MQTKQTTNNYINNFIQIENLNKFPILLSFE